MSYQYSATKVLRGPGFGEAVAALLNAEADEGAFLLTTFPEDTYITLIFQKYEQPAVAMSVEDFRSLYGDEVVEAQSCDCENPEVCEACQ